MPFAPPVTDRSGSRRVRRRITVRAVPPSPDSLPAGRLTLIKRLPNSYYCKRCGRVLTKLDEYAP